MTGVTMGFAPSKRGGTIVALISSVVLHAGICSCRNPFDGAPAPEWKQIGPDAYHMTESFAEGPLNFNVMRINLAAPEITLEAESGKGDLFRGESVVDAAKRETIPGKRRVIGGVNADFWRSNLRLYTPVGMLVSDGMIQMMPDAKRSAFVMTSDERVCIKPVSLRIAADVAGSRIIIRAINEPENKGGAILITPDFAREVPAFSGRAVLLKLPNGEFLPNQVAQAQVVSIERAAKRPAPPADHLLLLVPEAAAPASLTVGQRVTIEAVCPEVPGVITTAVGGAPKIVEEGKRSVRFDEEGVGKSFSTDKHPRTAVGIGKDGRTIYFVTVDGRQPRVSIGQDLYSLADYMVRLGCWEAINMDGGGSTTMVVHGAVVNKPSDRGGPRSVANSLLAVSRSSSGRLMQIGFDVARDPLTVPVGASVSIKLQPLDELHYPIAGGMVGTLRTELSGLVAPSLARDGSLSLRLSSQAGAGKVTVYDGAASGTLRIAAVPLDDLTVKPEVLVLRNGESVDLSVHGVSRSAPALVIEPNMAHISAANSLVQVSGEAVTAHPSATGSGTLTVELGGKRRQLPYHVGVAASQTIAGFDSPTAYGQVTGRNYSSTATTLVSEPATKKGGSGALRINYAMSGRGRSQISVPLNAPIPGDAAKLGLWIYGDGKEQWVRAIVTDAKGTSYTADFTDGGKGVFWNGEWRQGECWIADLIPEDSGQPRVPTPPLRVASVYVAQEQEAMKGTGSLVLDELQAICPPHISNIAETKKNL